MSYENKRIAVIGAGSFGTALAMTLSGRGHTVTMWARRKEQIEEMSKEHSNSHYLPGVVLPEELLFTDNLEDAVSGKDLLLFAVPAQKFREVFAEAMKYADVQIPIVNVAKGIEKGTLLRLSEVAEEISPNCKFIALSVPCRGSRSQNAYNSGCGWKRPRFGSGNTGGFQYGPLPCIYK